MTGGDSYHYITRRRTIRVRYQSRYHTPIICHSRIPGLPRADHKGNLGLLRVERGE